MIFYQVTATTSNQLWGDNVNTQKQRISVKWVSTVTGNITDVLHRIIKHNSPSDNVTLTIYQGGTNAENGTSLGTSVVNSSTFPTSGTAQTTFTFSTPIAITSGTTYWFTWTRATLDSTNDFSSFDNDDGSGNGYVYVPIDGGWENLTGTQGHASWDIQVNGTLNNIDNSLFFAGD